ncbi:MAG: hypothetical protein JW776_10580 [Candidatus Lokiarchaeota archaeon]|nr:hypothetical protein [Candidatus Lokiarchaeota archaeon]
MKIEEITETIEIALGDIASILPSKKMLYHASCNGNRENTNYIFILEMFDETEYKKIRENHIRLDDPDHIASELLYNKRKLKTSDYKIILDSLYHGIHKINFAESVKILFNLSHWLLRNYIIAENFKYNLTSKTNGTVFYSFKTGKREEFQLVVFLDRLADGGLVLNPADHDFVAPIENKVAKEQEEEQPPFLMSS